MTMVYEHPVITALLLLAVYVCVLDPILCTIKDMVRAWALRGEYVRAVETQEKKENEG
jgi:hypothetical protein